MEQDKGQWIQPGLATGSDAEAGSPRLLKKDISTIFLIECC